MIKVLVKVTNSISVLTDLLLTCIYNHSASTCIVMNGILRQIFESFSKKKLNNFDTSLHRLRLEIMNGANCKLLKYLDKCLILTSYTLIAYSMFHSCPVTRLSSSDDLMTRCTQSPQVIHITLSPSGIYR